jgi:uncharacterized cupin superfamily protein
MTVVIETMSNEPFDRPERIVERDEAKLFEAPPAAAQRFLGAELTPLAIYTIPMAYAPVSFSRPEGVFEGPSLRLEWQTMTGRQPFYHRNADVDEISYQICGERALITECGTVRFDPGQFARIPVGVAHDNYGVEDIHLIFYLHGPAVPGVAPVAHGRHAVPPFEGWEAKPMIEALTNAMGAPGGSIAYSMVDETLILDAARRFPDPLEVIEPCGPAGQTEWLYRAPKVWIGHTALEPTRERQYRRRLCADEIQFQVAGTRTIVSQRGVVTLQPGDFTCIPRGCAHASVTDERSRHLSILTAEPVPPVAEPVRLADTDVAGWLAGTARAAGGKVAA